MWACQCSQHRGEATQLFLTSHHHAYFDTVNCQLRCRFAHSFLSHLRRARDMEVEVLHVRGGRLAGNASSAGAQRRHVSRVQAIDVLRRRYCLQDLLLADLRVGRDAIAAGSRAKISI